MDKRTYRLFSLLMAVTYMVSYLTRNNLGAVLVDMIATLGWTKASTSIILTGSFITYGSGQILSGIIGDKVQPKWLIFSGLSVSVLMNLLIPFCKTPTLMLAVWCVNGLAQAFMWPPIVKLLSDKLSDMKQFANASMAVSVGSYVGTVLIYLTAPLLILWFDWRAVFFASAIAGALMALVWFFMPLRVEMKKKAPETSGGAEPDRENKRLGMKKLFAPVMIAIFVAIAAQGFLRDGVTTWMPSYISETYDLGSEISILTGVILPVFSIIGAQIYLRIYTRWFKNPVTFSAAAFLLGTVSALGVALCTGVSFVGSVIFSALLTTCMHAVNYALIALVPPCFKKYGNVSTASGVVNSATYIGSAVSTYGIAAAAEGLGWGVTTVMWIAIAAIGGVICLLSIKGFKRGYLSTNEKVEEKN